jgi:hypothetical protein
MMMMGAVSISETAINFHETTLHNIPEHHQLFTVYVVQE